MAYIKSITPNLFGGKFSSQIEFEPGLNILSGENGTGKTQLLSLIKSGKGATIKEIETSEESHRQVRIQAISPKRNAERKSFEAAVNELQRQNKRLAQYLQELDQQNIIDHQFTTYPSVAELYYYEYEALCRDGGKQIEKMNEVTDELNWVIQSVLDQVELCSEWENGSPKLTIFKNFIAL